MFAKGYKVKKKLQVKIYKKITKIKKNKTYNIKNI